MFGDVNRCDGRRASASILCRVLFPFKKGIAERGDIIRSDEPEPVDRFGKRNGSGEAFGLRTEFFELALGGSGMQLCIEAQSNEAAKLRSHTET